MEAHFVTVRKLFAFAPLLLFLATANGVVFAQHDAGRGVDVPSVFDRLEAQDARIRDIESRLERQSQPVQMLPAEHEQVSDNQGMNLNARLAATPYYCDGGRHLLHLGTGINYTDDQDDSVLFAARPEVHEGLRFVDSGAIAVEDFYTINAEAALVYGPLSLQSELFYTRTSGVGPATDLDFYGAFQKRV